MSTASAGAPIRTEATGMPSLWPVVLALGVTQNIGYGTLHYAYAIMAPKIAAEFAVSLPAVFGVFSAGLLLGGLAAPWLGRAMDRHGAPRLMALGSLLAAPLVAGMALAPSLAIFAVLVLALEVVAVLVLYDAAFATLALLAGKRARRAITHLTLLGGFASTMFWPLTGWLEQELGWRATYTAFALLHLFVALPLHLWLARRAREGRAVRNLAGAPAAQPPLLHGRAALTAFWAVGISFALSGIIMAALSVHLIGVLQSLDLGTATYLVAMLMGPSQVLIRLTDALFWRGLHPLGVGLIAAAVLPVALAALLLPLPAVIAGVAFAVLFGFGQGLSSIVRGTVPLALFGNQGFAGRLGQLAAIRTVLGAGAPFLFAAGVEMLGMAALVWSTIALGIAALLPLLAVALVVRRAT